MAKWCWLGIHKWTKWSQPKTVHYIRYKERYTHMEEYEITRDEQKRTCENCGQTEFRYCK